MKYMHVNTYSLFSQHTDRWELQISDVIICLTFNRPLTWVDRCLHTHTHSPLICRTPKKIVLIHHNTQNNAFSAFSFSWYGGEVTHCHHGNCLLLLPVLNSIVSLTGITLTYFYLCAKHICRCVWLFYWHFITFSQYIHTTIKRTQTKC